MSYNTVSEFGLYAFPQSIRHYATDDSTYVQRHLDVAASQIDLLLESRYSSALETVPPIIKWMELTIAGKNIVIEQGMPAESTDIQHIMEQYYTVMGRPDTKDKGLLGRLAEGSLTLPDSAGGSPERPRVSTIQQNDGSFGSVSLDSSGNAFYQ